MITELVETRILNPAKALLSGRKLYTGAALAGGSVLLWAFRAQLLDLAHWGVGMALGEDVPLFGGSSISSTHQRALDYIEAAADEVDGQNPELAGHMLDLADRIEDGTVWPDNAPDAYVMEKTLHIVQKAPATAAKVRQELIRMQQGGSAAQAPQRSGLRPLFRPGASWP